MPASTTFTWTGATSTNWNDAKNWAINGLPAGAVPSAGDNITIPATAANQPAIPNGQAATLVSLVDNDGTITVNGAQFGTQLNIGATGATSVTLQSDKGFTGVILLSNSSVNTLQGGVAGASLENVNNIIEGGGSIEAGAGLTFQNDAAGVIDGDDSTTLIIGVNITNNGLIEATGSGGVLINNGAVINQSGGGTLEANGGNVSLSSATIEGGTLTATGSNEIVAGGGTNLLDGLTGGAVTISNNSTVAIANGNTLFLQGAIVNDGTLAINAAQFGTQLDIGFGANSSVTLSGGGVVSLADSSNSHIQGGAAAAATLTNVNDTIEGGGSIQAGPNGLTVVNQGVIDATVGTTLSISVAVTNEGTLEATAGTGGLSLSATVDNTDAGANNLGKIIAGALGEANALQVALNGATIIGGTLTTVNSGDSIVAASGTDLLDGSKPNDALTIALASTVAIANSHALSLAGSIVNKGTISSNAAQFGTDLDIGAASSASVTLSGGGVVSLSNSSNNVIQGSLAASSLTNVDNTIEGAGTIQAGAGLTFVNDSTVNANQTTGLTITVGVTNNALIESTNTGGLTINSGAVINQSGGGTLEANGGNVTLSSATIEGGTLTSTGSNAILAGSGTNLLDGVTGGAVTISNNSTVGVSNGDSLYLPGSIVNDGTLALYAAQFGTNLDIGSGTNTSVTLSGGGVVSLSNSSNNNIVGAAATTATLTNVNNTIEGGGTIQGGPNGLTVVNQAAINANTAATLSISAPVANSGTLESTTGTGGLSLSATIDNTSGGKNNLGQIIAGSTTEANATQVVLNGATIIGGTLTTVNPGDLIVVASGTDLLDGSTTAGASTISKGSTVQINNSQNLSVAGSIVNKGTISVDGAQFGTNLDVGSASSASVTLSGGGVVLLSNSGANSIQGNLATSSLTNVDNTIEGAGTIQAGTGLAFTNDGAINANQSNALTITLNVTNNGTIEATGGGGLTINNGALINQSGGGTLEANGGNVSLGGATIEGGTVTTLGTSAVLATGGTNLLDGKTGGAVTISTGSAVQIANSQNLALEGSIVNKGTISLNGAQFGTNLDIGSGGNASVSLSGGGTVSLSNSSNNNILDGTAGAATFTNLDNTIEGAGAIHSGAGLTVVNDGVINANLTTGLVINAAITNNSTIESTNTGGITLNGNVVISQSGGGSIQGQAGTVALSNATIIGGTLTTTAGLIAATGGTDLLDGKTGGALTISSGSNVQVTNGNSLSLDGVINNDGTITVNGAQFGTQLNIGATGATSVTLQSDKGSSGVVVLSNSTNNHLQGGVAGASFENVNDTIEGGGSIQAGVGLFFQNDAAGVVDADDAATLTISTNITNNGLIEATGAGGLLINSGAVINQSGGGTLEANGGNVSLSNATLEGGTLTSTGSNQIVAGGGTNVLDGVTGGALTISKGSTVAVSNSNALFLQGAIVNDGTLAVNGAQFGTVLNIGSGANTSVTLSGGGVVSMSNSSNNYIQGDAAAPSTLTNVSDTIEGVGTIQGGAGLTVLNSGVIDADTGGATLSVTTTLTNQASGVLRAEQGGRLNIQNALTNIASDPNHTGGNVLTGGTYDVVDAASGASTIAITGGSGGITTLAAAVNLAGASSTLMDNGTTLAQSLVEVAAGGALNLTFGVNSSTQQNFSDGSAVTIDKGGSVSVTGAAFATGGLTISVGGQLQLTGAFAGTTAESATVAGNIANSGSIVVAGVTPGAVQPSAVLESAITGTGAIAVNQDALADFEAGVGVGQTITFGDNQVLGGGGVAGVETVQIQSSSLTTTGVGASDFSATLAGFKVGDAIDLAHFSGETNYAFDGTTLTVNFTTGGTATLKLSGVGAKTGFHFGSDGASGTLITTATSLQLAHDTGVSATDGLTDNPALTGASDAGATLTFTDGGKTLGTTVVNADGTFNFTPTGLSDGTQTITASEGGAASGTESASVTFTLATAAPAVTGAGLSGVTNKTSDTISGVVTPEALTGSGVASVQIVDASNNVVATATLGANGGYSATIAPVVDGAHVYTVVATDDAGNVTKLALPEVDVATAAPTVSASESVSGATTQTSDTITITAASEAVANDKIASVVINDGSTTLGSATLTSGSATNGTYSFTASNLALGAHNFSVVTTDAAGNSTTSTLASVTVQPSNGPTVANITESPSGLTNSKTVTISETATPAQGATVASVQVLDGATPLGSATLNSATGVWSFTTATLADGAHNLSTVTTDNFDHQTTTAFPVVDIATQAPVNGSASESVSGITNKTSDTVSVTPTVETVPGNGVKSVNIVDTTTNATTPATLGTAGVYSATVSGLSDGAHTLEIVTTDLAGNQTTTLLPAVDVATKGPVVSASETVSGATTATSDTISETATAESVPNDSVASVVVYDGATKLGTATLTNGVWSFTASNLTSGTHNFSTITTDLAGNSTTTTLAAVTVSTSQPPTVSASQTQSGLTDLTADTITETATASGGLTIASVEVFDGKTDLGAATFNSATNQWSFTASGLSDGAHDFTTVTTDSGGQKTTTALAELDVATQAPTVTATQSASGPTHLTQITLSGTATAEAVPGDAIVAMEIYNGFTPVGPATLTPATGAWTFTESGLADGVYNFQALTVDAAGNTAITPFAEVDVATAPPTVTASESLSGLTNKTADVITETATAEAVGANAIASVQVYDGATRLGDATLSGGKYSFTTATLADGAHHLSTVTTDAAGNATTTTLAEVYVATRLPTVTASESVSGLTNKTSDTITETATAEAVGANAIASVQVYDGAKLLGAATLSGGKYSYTATGLPDGGQTLSTVTTDAARNVTTKSLAEVYVATRLPTVTASESVSGLTNKTADTITETATAEAVAANAIASVQVYDGATLLGAATLSGGKYSYTASGLTDGAHVLKTVTTDTAGNVRTTTLAEVDVATAPPTVTASESLSGLTNKTADVITETETAEAVGSNAIASVRVYDGTTLLGAATLSGGKYSFTTATLADGAHHLSTVTTDAAGNATTTTLAEVDVATKPPTVTASESASGLTTQRNITVSETATAEAVGSNAIASVQVYDGTTLLGSATLSGATYSFTTATLAYGVHNLSTVTTDAAGNSTTTTLTAANVEPPPPNVTIALSDDTSHGLEITSNGTVTGGGDANAVVNFTIDGVPSAQTATANASGVWTFSPASLQQGANTIVASETNGGGTGTATLAFTYDTIPPAVAIATPAATVAFPTETIDGSGEAGSTVQLFDGSQELGGPLTVGSNGLWSEAVTLSGAGAHAITATATDAANNVRTSAAVSLFLDNQVTGQPSQFALTGTSGSDHILVNANNALVTTLGGNDTVSLTSAGGASQFHVIVGGGGSDTLDLSGTGGGATVDLSHNSAVGSQIGTNLVFNFNNIIGGGGAETLKLKSAGGTVQAGSGADVITGGAASDTFAFLSSFGVDTITNFQVAGATHDVFEVSQNLFANWQTLDAALSDTAAGAQLTLSATESVTFTGATKAGLEANHAADFRFV